MKKIFKKTTGFLLASLFTTVLPITALAETFVFSNPTNQTSLMGIVNAALGFLVQIGAMIAILFLVYSGFLFVFARGDEGQLKKARETFFWTIVGGLILLGAFALSEIIKNTAKNLGVEI